MPETTVDVFTLAGQLEAVKQAYAARSQELARLVRRAQVPEAVAQKELRQLQKRIKALRRAIAAEQLDLFSDGPVEALKGLR